MYAYETKYSVTNNQYMYEYILVCIFTEHVNTCDIVIHIIMLYFVKNRRDMGIGFL
jgi:hypothetical protein